MSGINTSSARSSAGSSVNSLSSFKPKSKLALSIISIGFIILGLSGAAALWDGGYFLFHILNDQEPFIANNRFYLLPIQLITIAVDTVTNNAALSQSIYSLS